MCYCEASDNWKSSLKSPAWCFDNLSVLSRLNWRFLWGPVCGCVVFGFVFGLQWQGTLAALLFYFPIPNTILSSRPFSGAYKISLRCLNYFLFPKAPWGRIHDKEKFSTSTSKHFASRSMCKCPFPEHFNRTTEHSPYRYHCRIHNRFEWRSEYWSSLTQFLIQDSLQRPKFDYPDFNPRAMVGSSLNSYSGTSCLAVAAFSALW